MKVKLLLILYFGFIICESEAKEWSLSWLEGEISKLTGVNGTHSHRSVSVTLDKNTPEKITITITLFLNDVTHSDTSEETKENVSDTGSFERSDEVNYYVGNVTKKVKCMAVSSSDGKEVSSGHDNITCIAVPFETTENINGTEHVTEDVKCIAVSVGAEGNNDQEESIRNTTCLAVSWETNEEGSVKAARVTDNVKSSKAKATQRERKENLMTTTPVPPTKTTKKANEKVTKINKTKNMEKNIETTEKKTRKLNETNEIKSNENKISDQTNKNKKEIKNDEKETPKSDQTNKNKAEIETDEKKTPRLDQTNKNEEEIETDEKKTLKSDQTNQNVDKIKCHVKITSKSDETNETKKESETHETNDSKTEEMKKSPKKIGKSKRKKISQKINPVISEETKTKKSQNTSKTTEKCKCSKNEKEDKEEEGEEEEEQTQTKETNQGQGSSASGDALKGGADAVRNVIIQSASVVGTNLAGMGIMGAVIARKINNLKEELKPDENDDKKQGTSSGNGDKSKKPRKPSNGGGGGSSNEETKPLITNSGEDENLVGGGVNYDESEDPAPSVKYKENEEGFGEV